MKKLEQIVNDIESLSAIELAELVKEIMNKFGIDQSALNVGTSASAGSSSDEVEEGNKLYKVVINEVKDADKIKFIKEVRSVLEIGLVEAKKVVETPEKPILLKQNLSKEDADKIKSIFSAQGLTVEVLAQ